MRVEVYFRCDWCNRQIHHPDQEMPPLNVQAFPNSADPTLPHDPWVSFKRTAKLGHTYHLLCCPDCFEHYFPPPILPATET